MKVGGMDDFPNRGVRTQYYVCCKCDKVCDPRAFRLEEAPMGIDEWIAMGEKYKYFEYYNETKKDSPTIIKNN
jgi:hypothetical protein